MKRIALSVALLCVLSVSGFAGDVPTCGLPVAGEIPCTGSPSPGEMPVGGEPSPGDVPTCGIVLTILDLLF